MPIADGGAWVIAVQPDVAVDNGVRESWSDRWLAALRDRGAGVRLVSVHAHDVIAQLEGCDGFLWRTIHTPAQKAVARRLIPVLDRTLGGCLYPDTRTYWHYDDKIAQKYLLESAGIPIPVTSIFWTHAAAERFLREASFPLVAKLYAGAGSSSVRLLTDRRAAERLMKIMFSGGVFRMPGSLGGAGYALRRRLRTVAKLALRGELAHPGSESDLHRGYLLLQEFLPENPFDTRVTIIGDRAFAFRRFNRPGDFRASGSGLIDSDPAGIDPRFIDLGFRVADVFGLQSVAIDGLYDRGRPVVAEISYTFLSAAIRSCPGHWRRGTGPGDGGLEWEDGPSWAEDAVLEDLLERIADRRAREEAFA